MDGNPKEGIVILFFAKKNISDTSSAGLRPENDLTAHLKNKSKVCIFIPW
jgi:hypothetical protein